MRESRCNWNVLQRRREQQKKRRIQNVGEGKIRIKTKTWDRMVELTQLRKRSSNKNKREDEENEDV